MVSLIRVRPRARPCHISPVFLNLFMKAPPLLQLEGANQLSPSDSTAADHMIHHFHEDFFRATRLDHPSITRCSSETSYRTIQLTFLPASGNAFNDVPDHHQPIVAGMM